MDREASKKTRRFILSTVSIYLAIVLAMASFSYVIDPVELFHPDRKVEQARQALEIIQDGHNVANIENYDERLVKRYATQLLPAHDTIVLGSSRAALISADMAGDESFFNYSVTGAMIQDLISIYGLLYKEGKLPERVIISLDMWWLNDNYTNDRYATAMEDGYCYYAAGRLGYTDIDIEAPEVSERYSNVNYEPAGNVLPWQAGSKELKEIFSVPYFQMSLESLLKEENELKATDEYLGENGILRADGSYGYPRYFREGSAATITHLASQWLPKNVLGCEDFAQSARKNEKIFYDFIKSLVEDGVEVDFLFTPINPVVYDHMQKYDRYDRAFEAEVWFLNLAAEFSIDTAGSFDPHRLGAEVSDFYDAPHYKLEEVAKLVQEIS